MDLLRIFASILSWQSICFGLRFQGDPGCKNTHSGLCDACGGYYADPNCDPEWDECEYVPYECDGYECYSPMVGGPVPTVLRIDISGSVARLTSESDWAMEEHYMDIVTRECIDPVPEEPLPFDGCTDNSFDGMYLLKLLVNGEHHLQWGASVCNLVDIFYDIYWGEPASVENPLGSPYGAVNGRASWCKCGEFTWNGWMWACANPSSHFLQRVSILVRGSGWKIHDHMTDEPSWAMEFTRKNEEFYAPFTLDLYGDGSPCPQGRFPMSGNPPNVMNGAPGWTFEFGCIDMGSTFDNPDCNVARHVYEVLCEEASLSATVSAASFEEMQSCCSHGGYCPDDAVSQTDAEIIEGMCCASVSVSGMDTPEPECYFGYPPAHVAPNFGGPFKHYACGTWISKKTSCQNPYPSKLVLSVPEINQSTCSLALTAREGVVTAGYPDKQWRYVTFSGSDELPACDPRPTQGFLAGIVMTSTDPGYENATASVSFGGAYSDCSPDPFTLDPDMQNSEDPLAEGATIANLDDLVWGWRLTYTDFRGVEIRLEFEHDGGMEWRNGLSTIRLAGDASTRPRTVQISLLGTCQRLGYSHGFCFDSPWLDAYMPTATCKVAEVIQHDVARWQYMQCQFLPGSHITLQPLLTAPDPLEGSVCDVEIWNMTWGTGAKTKDDITLTWDSGADRWQWIPEADHQAYALTRTDNGVNGEGNYELEVALSYPITSVVQEDIEWPPIDGYFTVSGTHDWEFVAGATFTVTDSTGNDGTYTVKESVLTNGTTIYVNEPIPVATVDGNITRNLRTTFTTGRAIHCCYASSAVPSEEAQSSYRITEAYVYHFGIDGDHTVEFAVGVRFYVSGSAANVTTELTNDREYTVHTVALVAEHVDSGVTIPERTLIEVTAAINNPTVASGSISKYGQLIDSGDGSNILTTSFGTEVVKLTAGGPFQNRLYTGCTSDCDAISWNVSVTGLRNGGTRSGSLRYYPQVGSWWSISSDTIICIVRTAENYVVYLTYQEMSVDEGANVYHDGGVFTLPAGSCCDAAEQTLHHTAFSSSWVSSGSDPTFVIKAVCNSAPELTLNAVSGIDEDGTAVLSGTITDDDEQAGITTSYLLQIDWGSLDSPTNTQSFVLSTATALTQEADGIDWTPSTHSFSVEHQYIDDRPNRTASDTYTIKATVTDNYGAIGRDSETVTVTNVVPVIDTFSVTATSGSGEVSLTGTYHDTGTTDTHQLTITWGDEGESGEPEKKLVTGGTFSASHTYTVADTYTVSITLADDDGDTDSDSDEVEITLP